MDRIFVVAQAGVCSKEAGHPWLLGCPRKNFLSKILGLTSQKVSFVDDNVCGKFSIFSDAI